MTADRVVGALTSGTAKSIYAGVAVASVLVGVLWGLVQLVGAGATAIYVGALLAGLAWLPAIWYVVGKELPRGWRGTVSRILWTIGSLIHGPYAADWKASGRVELVPADPERDRVYVDGEWEDVDPDGNWSRLGKQRFLVTYEKTPAAFDGTTVTEDDQTATPIYLGTRGGEPVGTMVRSTATDIVVDLGRVASRWRGAAGGALADAAKKDALLEFGGQLDISTRWLVLGILGSLALGTISGYVLFAA